jgi:deoxyribodipyrimidine photolyase-related protein
MRALLILGNQLFAPKLLQKDVKLFMREDFELCTYYKFHKHKIIFFLASMRSYAEELRKAGFDVHYEELKESSLPYERHFLNFLKSQKIKEVLHYEIEDKFFESRIVKALQNEKIKVETLSSPMFLTSRSEFLEYLKTSKKPLMKNFYERQRKRLNILTDTKQNPIGGKWSFDEENRLKLPADVMPPALLIPKPSEITVKVAQLCDQTFSSHPGESKNFWLPVDRKGAQLWLHQFLTERLCFFGPYEDALPSHTEFVFHSVLTPFLNTGWLTPEEVVQKTLSFAKEKKISMASVEGFIRQVIGWREFVRGIYQNFSEKQDSANFWNHKGRLTQHWYDAQTLIPPLDASLKKVNRYGYAHHIERLMVIGSLMLLLEVDPKEAHRWFMEMFIDSSDWVMGPNVYGMALFSDGGIFATKPYICGSNYYRKMGPFKTGDWCDGVDGLYWQFIEKHKSFFMKNPRLSMMARTVEKMDPVRKLKIYKEADRLKRTLTF